MALDDASDACPKRCCCTAAAGWATSNGTVEFGASGDDDEKLNTNEAWPAPARGWKRKPKEGHFTKVIPSAMHDR